MRNYNSSEIRNIVMIGQKGVGKTSLGEAMLFAAKATTRLGKVEDGNTVLDFEPEEHKRVGSVQASLATLEWNKHKINILDTPGSRDFLGDTQNCIGVSEGALVVVSGPDGVDPYSVRLFKRAAGMGRCIVINQMGRDRADFYRTLGECKETLIAQAVPVTLPIGQEDSFRGVVDLLSLKAHIYEPCSQKGPSVEDVPADLRDAVTSAREALLEEIAGTDEALMEKYLDSGELSEEDAQRGLRKAIASGDLCPVFASDGAHNIGVAEILDAVVDAFPSAAAGRRFVSRQGDDDVEIEAKPDGDFIAVVFKTVMDQHAGKISMFRIVSGKATKDSHVENVGIGSERFGSLLSLQGKKINQIDEAVMGDIVAVAKLKETHTGATLARDKKASLVALPEVPPTQITFRIIPQEKADEDKIGVSVERIREEDPTLIVGHDAITSHMTLSGFGVAHIDVALEKMARKYGVEVEKLQPLVSYLEAITRPVKNIEGKHKKQSGGRGQFGVCYINMRPLERGEGFKFVNSIVGGSIPRQYIPAVEKGIEEASKKGVLAGYPVVDFEVEVFDGKYHDVDSSEMAFKVAGSKAFKEGVQKAGVGIIEPIMNVDIEVPKECLGDVVGDVSQRRGRVLGMDSAGAFSTVKSQIPQAEILSYAPDLKSMTGGRGSFTAVFSHYDPLPGNLTDKVIAASPNRPKGDVEEEAAADKKKKK